MPREIGRKANAEISSQIAIENYKHGSIFIIHRRSSFRVCGREAGRASPTGKYGVGASSIGFSEASPHTQVSIVVWELEHRRPSSSRFDYLLDRNGLKVGPVLLAEAVRTKSFDVNVTLLLEFAELGGLQVADDDGQLAAAIARCYELGGQGNRECGEIRLKLAPRVLRKKR
ncbi:hypothetical protein [Lysobacter enzymogenes]|uniref:hypothetical protein n=1 Tax=Lysobacter enzymogenes TaxID=69 RepID=UPI0019CFE9C0|nr:hypothetical protein [Lysobacter enzymogenes]